MIERLNFYDLYGYLLPGAALIGIGILPLLLTGSAVPSLEWSSALATLILGYVLGHLIQIVSRIGFDEQAQPSDELMTSPNGFPAHFKSQLTGLLRKDFKLDVMDAAQRRIAFNACRYAVQSADVPSYAEQFQGLYALMRGLAAAAIVGAGYHVGWVAGALQQENVIIAIAVAASGSAGVWVASPIRLPMRVAVAAALVCGWTVNREPQPVHQLLGLVLTAVLLTVAARLFLASYNFFRRAFAETVYSVYSARRRSPLTRSEK